MKARTAVRCFECDSSLVWDYRQRRRQYALGWLTPIEFEAIMTTLAG